MSRLTERNENGCAFTYTPIHFCGDCHIGEAIDKLADYEDAEEQGLLIRVPSKKGDKVYRITQYTRETKEVFAGYDHLGAKWDIEYVYDYEIEEIKFDLSHVKEWNKRVFATKEEAEQKLAEMKGE